MYFQPLESPLASTALAPASGEPAADPFAAAAPAALAGDAISRLVPPFAGGPANNPLQTLMFGPLAGLLQQLTSLLSQLLGGGGMGGGAGLGGCPIGGGNERYFAGATGASEGDPHLSFNGSHWNSMASQPDLLESNSIPGGFRIATQVTPPAANGATFNQSATVSLDGGATSVSLNDAGVAQIVRNGQEVPIAPGQSVALGNGASVLCEANGTLRVSAENGYGGRIVTTLTAQGKGVNVGVNAQNVDLGGALVAGSPTPEPPQPPFPIGGPPGFGPLPMPPLPPIGFPLPPPIATPPIAGPIGPLPHPPIPPIVMHPF